LPSMSALVITRDEGTVNNRAANGTCHGQRLSAFYDSARLIDPTAVFPPRDGGDALITGTSASSGSATGPGHGNPRAGRLWPAGPR
jgi:hypothetical protein